MVVVVGGALGWLWFSILGGWSDLEACLVWKILWQQNGFGCGRGCVVVA